MAGRLYRMAKVVSANPASWGIVDANQISGFRTVATQADLYSIAACILSSSYGDGTTNGNDAIGQIWHVQEGNGGKGKDFRLTSWASRGTSAGWEEVLYADSVYSKSEIDGKISTINKNINTVGNAADAASVAASAAQTTANAAKNQATANATAIAGKADKATVETLSTKVNDIETAVGKKADNSLVDIIAGSVNSNTGDIVDIKNKLAKKADLVNGKLDPEQLPDIDTTLYELAPNNTLPSTLADINKNHIYLVKADTAGTNNVYAEYIYTGTSATYDATKWEKLGEVSAKVDLSGYATTTYVQNAVSTAKHDVKPDTVNFTKHTDTTDLDIDIRNSDGTKLTKPIPIPLVNIDGNTNGLMSPTMLTKLNGLNNYTHPTHPAKDTGLYKIAVDSLGHVSAATPVGKKDITDLGIPGSAGVLLSQVTPNANEVAVKLTYNGSATPSFQLDSATSENAGVMSAAAYTKLNGIDEGANKTDIDQTVSATGTNPVSGKGIYDAIDTHKMTSSNLDPSSGSTDTIYTLLACDENDNNNVHSLGDLAEIHFATDGSTSLVIDTATYWNDLSLRAITNDELTEILR